MNMASNNKSFHDLSYSINIGPSIYYVFSRRARNPKCNDAYSLAEKNAIRSKSANTSIKLPTLVQHSKSRRQSTSSERQSKASRHRKVTFDGDRISNQGSPTSDRVHHHRHYTRSNSKNTKQITDKLPKNKREASTESLHRETTGEKSSSVVSNQNEENESIKITTNNQNQEIIRLFNEQKHSLAHLLEQHTGTITCPSTDAIKQIVLETLQSQEQIFTRELEHTLIQTVQQELQKLLPKTDDKSPLNLLDTHTSNQLQDLITQTVEQCITSIIKDHNNTLNHLFTEQKQALVETLLQQQPTASINLIKQALVDALIEHRSPSATTNTINPRPSNNEIEITADIKQTRTDTAFRLQRDTIVANRYFRDNVRQWSNVNSISFLIQKIQECSTTDIENAWLLFCWIGQNILYDLTCLHNSAEHVFENRLGSSHGFVNLYHQCCSLLNIQCLKIEGYAKQNDDFKQSAHIWNGIILDQYIYLIDPTWGAGGGDNTNEFEDFYFLTSPEEFIYTHYSKDYQLLQPKLTKQEFLSLPIMKSNYYRLNLNFLSPKQGLNQSTENIFKISLKTPAYVDLMTSLQINSMEYPPHLHTLCQHDILQTDVINCFFAPPTNGLYEILIYAKTNNEMKYQETIYMRLNVSNISQGMTFPIRSQSFIEYKCVLIEPFRRLIQENERLYIHMKIPDAHVIKIKNGDESIQPNTNEYRDGLLRIKVFVRGDIRICARWSDQTRKLSTICIFNMI